VLERVFPLVVVVAIAAVTYRRMAVMVMMVVVMGKMMIHIQSRFLDSGRPQGYV